METAPIGISYNLGDVMYDFTVKLPNDGNDSTPDTFTLSEILKEKDMLKLIKFPLI